jgi:acetolactate synthase-1/3 small subunit
MKRFTVAILVNNQFGVLNRVTSMFRRRQFNISALTVSETESAKYSRITVISESDDIGKQQLINQLYKLPDVCSIVELYPSETVSRELLLIKVANHPETRSDVKAAIDAFEGKIVDYTREATMVQMVGDSSKIDAFINLLRDYDILEICRTGAASLERGDTTIRRVTNL